MVVAVSEYLCSSARPHESRPARQGFQAPTHLEVCPHSGWPACAASARCPAPYTEMKTSHGPPSRARARDAAGKPRIAVGDGQDFGARAHRRVLALRRAVRLRGPVVPLKPGARVRPQRGLARRRVGGDGDVEVHVARQRGEQQAHVCELRREVQLVVGVARGEDLVDRGHPVLQHPHRILRRRGEREGGRRRGLHRDVVRAREAEARVVVRDAEDLLARGGLRGPHGRAAPGGGRADVGRAVGQREAEGEVGAGRRGAQHKGLGFGGFELRRLWHPVHQEGLVVCVGGGNHEGGGGGGEHRRVVGALAPDGWLSSRRDASVGVAAPHGDDVARRCGRAAGGHGGGGAGGGPRGVGRSGARVARGDECGGGAREHGEGEGEGLVEGLRADVHREVATTAAHRQVEAARHPALEGDHGARSREHDRVLGMARAEDSDEHAARALVQREGERVVARRVASVCGGAGAGVANARQRRGGAGGPHVDEEVGVAVVGHDAQREVARVRIGFVLEELHVEGADGRQLRHAGDEPGDLGVHDQFGAAHHLRGELRDPCGGRDQGVALGAVDCRAEGRADRRITVQVIVAQHGRDLAGLSGVEQREESGAAATALVDVGDDGRLAPNVGREVAAVVCERDDHEVLQSRDRRAGARRPRSEDQRGIRCSQLRPRELDRGLVGLRDGTKRGEDGRRPHDGRGRGLALLARRHVRTPPARKASTTPSTAAPSGFRRTTYKHTISEEANPLHLAYPVSPLESAQFCNGSRDHPREPRIDRSRQHLHLSFFLRLHACTMYICMYVCTTHSLHPARATRPGRQALHGLSVSPNPEATASGS